MPVFDNNRYNIEFILFSRYPSIPGPLALLSYFSFSKIRVVIVVEIDRGTDLIQRSISSTQGSTTWREFHLCLK